MVSKLIKILIEDKLGNIRNINILRSNLPKYQKISKIGRQTLLKKLKKFFFVKDKIKGVRGVAESGRMFIVYTFPMYKIEILEEKIDKIMERVKKRYDKVKNNNPSYEAQRVGVVIISKDSQTEKRLNRKTKRFKTFLLMDEISTISHGRDSVTTNFMFLDLRNKILKYIRGELTASPTVFSDTERFSIKYFKVYFAKN